MQRKKKSVVTVLLLLGMVASISACGSSKTKDASEAEQSNQQVEETAAVVDQEELEETAKSSQDAEEETAGTSKEGKVLETRDASQDELKQLSKWMSEDENYGFFLSTYNDPKDADYDAVFYSQNALNYLYTKEGEKKYDQLKKEYEKLVGGELNYDLQVMRKSDVDEFLREKVNLSVDDIKLHWLYSEKYDMYFDEKSDTNRTNFVCLDGEVEELDNGQQRMTVTIQCALCDETYGGTGTAVILYDGSDYKIESCVTPNQQYTE